jgi:uncharacterized membrane protein
VNVAVAADVDAPREAVWALISDPDQMLHVIESITRWEAVSDPDRGLGARYRMLMRVGSTEIGGLVEMVEWRAPADLAWNGVTGIDQRGRLRLRERPGGRTRVELRLAYDTSGSMPWGWIAERVAATMVRNNLRRALEQLSRQVS